MQPAYIYIHCSPLQENLGSFNHLSFLFRELKQMLELESLKLCGTPSLLALSLQEI